MQLGKKIITRQTSEKIWRGQVIQTSMASFYNRFLAMMLQPHLGMRILEIGMGLGNVTEFLIERPEAYVGIDLVDEHIQIAKERFADKCFEGYTINVENSEEIQLLKSKDFDSMVSVNCLEHLKDDVAVIASLYKLSNPGTKFAFLIPAHPQLYGALDIQAGHYRRYNQRELRCKLEDAGFKVEGMRYFNVIGAIAWFLIGKIPAKNKPFVALEKVTWQWKLLYSVLNAAKFPLIVLFLLEKAIPCPFGLSLIVWGKKE